MHHLSSIPRSHPAAGHAVHDTARLIFRSVRNGILADLLATGLLALLMLSHSLLPQIETQTLLIGMARTVLADTGLPAPLAGWLWFFLIGGLWWGSCLRSCLRYCRGGRYRSRGWYSDCAPASW